MRNPRFRVFFSIFSAVVLFTLLYNSSFIDEKWSGAETSTTRWRNLIFLPGSGVKHRRIMQRLHESSLIGNNTNDVGNDKVIKLMDLQICDEFLNHKGYKTHCDFLIANPDCTSGGFFNYIKFFYCDCKDYSFLGYIVLGSWLAILFYLLGNTASDYFCCSLENLSNLLKMSPTIAGVTLLPLGNGVSDVFASIAAFMGTGSGDVGLNGVLGGAVFITCIVVGVISLSVADKRVQIDKKCFIRDIGFLLVTITCLTLIMVIGKVTVLGSVAFLSIYVVYAVYIAVNEVMRDKSEGLKSGSLAPLLPVDNQSINAPLLGPDNRGNQIGNLGNHPDILPKESHWIWSSNFALYSDYAKATSEDSPIGMWGWSGEEEHSRISFTNLCWLLEMPLHIPRRLTIPTIDEDSWSKMYAIASTFLAPILLAFLWNTRENINPWSGKIAYFAGFGIGFVLSVLASLYTTTDHPPRKFLFPWIFGGFFMSIIWFYILADELVSLLVSLGTILGINPSMLALTVLAWGNSMNDLMSNTAFAMNERDGVQIAMSGCYAGPMFNTLIGLGVSLVLGAWSMGSDPYVVPRDIGLFVTVAFLTIGIIWSLVVLPQNDMRPNKVLGVGLIIIYALFLSIRISMALGISSLNSLGFGLL